MKTMARPSLLSLSMTSKSCVVSRTVRLEVGSSRMRTLAEEMSSARAMAAICWIATEYEPSGRVTSMSMSRPARISLARLFIAFQSTVTPQRMGARPMSTFSATVRLGQRLTSW